MTQRTEAGEFLPVSEEIVDLFDMGTAAEECRDICVKSVFRTRRAIFYGKQAIKHRRDAWKLISELYPELTGRLAYHPGKGVKVISNRNPNPDGSPQQARPDEQ